MYSNNGIQIWNKGKIIFYGRCVVGNNSSIITGKQGLIEIGDDTIATASVSIISYIGVRLGRHTSLGFGTMLMDTNFHKLYDIETKRFKQAYGKIIIGDYNWFATQCLILHSVKTPERCIFSARSVVTRGCRFESYSVHGGSPLQVLSRNVIRTGHDTIDKYTDE